MGLVLAYGVLIVAIALLFAGAWVGRLVDVDDELRVSMPAEEVERRILGPLGSMPGVNLERADPGQLTLVVMRTPGWIVFLAIIASPVGLLLLFLRQKLQLFVRVSPDGSGGSFVQVVGKTRRVIGLDVGDRLQAALR